jgi:Concanavalin A-like lectin/glucanases superfamily/Secretion system C-terminal sorting domain
MESIMKNMVFIIFLLLISSFTYSQSIIWEETFEIDPGNWTLDENWGIADDMLILSSEPETTSYDLSAISPLIPLPQSVSECIITQYFQENSAVDEVAEISIIYNGSEDVIWSWDLSQGNWGVVGGEDLTLSIDNYAEEEVQFRFRSYGSATINYDFWNIFNIAISAIDQPPANFTAALVDNDVVMEWEPPADQTNLIGYNVYNNEEMINAELVTDLFFTDENIDYGTYTYYVTAVYEGGFESISSNQITIVYINSESDNALHFDGIDDELVISADPALNPTSMITVEAWVKLNSLTDIPTIIGNEDWSNGEAGYILRVDNYVNINTPQFQVGTNNNWQSASAPSGSIPLDTWTHVAGTFDGSAIRVFINGVEEGYTPHDGSIIPSTIDIRIGSHWNSYVDRMWNGVIDEVRIWNVAHSEEEIFSNMIIPLTGVEPGLVALWRFESGSGNEAIDFTGNGHTGLINGAEWTDGYPMIIPPGTVEGTVYNSETMAYVENAIITLDTIQVITDIHGDFSLDILQGTYQLTCEHEDYQFFTYPEDIVVLPNETLDLEIELIPINGYVTGTVIDSVTMAPVENALITMGTYLALTDIQGDFSLDILQGTYQLTCEQEDYQFFTYPEDVNVIANETINIEIELIPNNGIVTGTVINSVTMALVENATITLDTCQVTTDIQGNFLIDIFPGTYQLTCEHEDYLLFTYPEDVNVISNETIDIAIELIPITGNDEGALTLVTKLKGNYPNPFNPSTIIEYSIDEPANVIIRIYNIKGQMVKTLVNAVRNADKHSEVWNGQDNNNNVVPSGIYFYKLETKRYSCIKKMILMK